MEQETLSHRKLGHAEEHIEMTTITSRADKSDEAVENPVQQLEITLPRTKRQENAEKIQFAALCWCLFLTGWNDASTGPLLPRIQDVYHVRLTKPHNSPHLTQYACRSDLRSYP